MSWKQFGLAIAIASAFALAGCAVSDQGALQSAFEAPSAPSSTPDDEQGSITTPGSPLQCVPYARQASGINIYGDAYTWWDQAAGRYERNTMPKAGAVLVLAGYGGPNRAHLAVVREVLSAREIKVDHANWLDDGAIYTNDPVVDVSSDNDWSQVKVWNIRAGAWGVHVYNVQGFIGPGPDVSGSDRVANNDVPADNGDQTELDQ